MRQRLRVGLIVVAAGAVLGLLFASVSTSDFAMHLDRQVHDVHCSFVPGLSGPERGESGCQVTLVSPYSSVMRHTVWGGVPVALPGMAVFAFLLFFAAEMWLTRRQDDVRTTGFLLLATVLPALTSIVMAYLSLVELDAACKLCIGIYLSSAICVGGATALFLRARRLAAARAAGEVAPERATEAPKVADPPPGDEPAWVSAKSAPADSDEEVIELTHKKAEPRPQTDAPAPARSSWGYLAAAFGIGVLFVVAPVSSYVAAAPDHSRFVGACGGLTNTEDAYGVMVSLDPHPGAPPAIEILDPLCPACRGFESALASSGLDDEMDRHALLFPLDDTCNWMVDSAVHPGACAVSYAMLCADDRSSEVLQWAFDHQEAIREAAAADPTAAARMVGERFPELRACIGSAPVKSRLNRSLRWAVSNRLPVLTPQLYVGGVKLCDEDVDLGLEFALPRMLSAYRNGTLKVTGGELGPAPEPPQPHREPAPAKPQPPPATGSPSPATGNQPPEPATGNQPPATAEPPAAEPPAAEPPTAEPEAVEPEAPKAGPPPTPADDTEPFPDDGDTEEETP